MVTYISEAGHLRHLLFSFVFDIGVFRLRRIVLSFALVRLGYVAARTTGTRRWLWTKIIKKINEIIIEVGQQESYSCGE